MRKYFASSIVFLFVQSSVFSQQPILPLERNEYQKVSSYDDLSSYIRQLNEMSDLMNLEVIGQSVKGRNIYALKFSDSEFGKDPTKIKVLFFAQQHGNEQSGKEGALLLAQKLLQPEYRYLFDRIDFALIPQLNPDGSELNQRRNANGADLNRNHLILSEPESQTLHQFFDRYLFEVSLDIHEYSPYGEDWKKYGYRKNIDVTFGACTNPGVSAKIREISNNQILPFVLKFLSDRKFSSFEYCPGGPPGVDYMRQSTFDINDGRQSLGIQNSFSFIQEGMNGKDMLIEKIKHRAEGQMTGMLGMLEYVFANHETMKSLVSTERQSLYSDEQLASKISVQTAHVPNGNQLTIPLLSYRTGNDTLVTVIDYRPAAKSIADVQKPLGYLIPKKQEALIKWMDRHSFVTEKYKRLKTHRMEQYVVSKIDSIDFEGSMIACPVLNAIQFQEKIRNSEYVYIPTAQLKGNLIVLALEPHSMLGLVTYPQFSYLIQPDQPFPILRVMKK